MLVNAAMHQALINRGLTYRLDCDTVEPKPKAKALGREGGKPSGLTRDSNCDTVESNKCQVRHVDCKGYGSCMKRSA